MYVEVNLKVRQQALYRYIPSKWNILCCQTDLQVTAKYCSSTISMQLLTNKSQETTWCQHTTEKSLAKKEARQWDL